MGDHSAIEWTDATWNPYTSTTVYGGSSQGKGVEDDYIEYSEGGRRHQSVDVRTITKLGSDVLEPGLFADMVESSSPNSGRPATTTRHLFLLTLDQLAPPWKELIVGYHRLERATR